MARIKQEQKENIAGKVGNVVACTWMGIPYLRSMPAHVNNPRTPIQQAQRSRFSVALNFLRPLTPVLRIGFREGAVGQSAFNAAMSYTMRYALTETPEEVAIDFGNVMVSQGSLTGAAEAAVSFADGKAIFTWNSSSRAGNASPQDHALTMVYHKASQQVAYETAGAFRREGGMELDYPKEWAAEDMAVYLGFWNEKEGIASNSVCLWGRE